MNGSPLSREHSPSPHPGIAASGGHETSSPITVLAPHNHTCSHDKSSELQQQSPIFPGARTPPTMVVQHAARPGAATSPLSSPWNGGVQGAGCDAKTTIHRELSAGSVSSSSFEDQCEGSVLAYAPTHTEEEEEKNGVVVASSDTDKMYTKTTSYLGKTYASTHDTDSEVELGYTSAETTNSSRAGSDNAGSDTSLTVKQDSMESARSAEVDVIEHPDDSSHHHLHGHTQLEGESKNEREKEKKRASPQRPQPPPLSATTLHGGPTRHQPHPPPPPTSHSIHHHNNSTSTKVWRSQTSHCSQDTAYTRASLASQSYVIPRSSRSPSPATQLASPFSAMQRSNSNDNLHHHAKVVIVAKKLNDDDSGSSHGSRREKLKDNNSGGHKEGWKRSQQQQRRRGHQRTSSEDLYCSFCSVCV